LISIYGNSGVIDMKNNKRHVVLQQVGCCIDRHEIQQVTCCFTTSGMLFYNKWHVVLQQVTCCFYNMLLTYTVRHIKQRHLL